MFGSELRNDIIRTAESAHYPAVVNNYVNNFVEWAKSQFNVPQDYNTARPLVDVLPVVNYKKTGWLMVVWALFDSGNGCYTQAAMQCNALQ